MNSTKALKLKSYSKLNLGLWVKEKRPDGYHEIETIFFENNSLYDEIEIVFEENDLLSVVSSFTQNDLNNLIPSDKNIATKAALLFLKKVNRNGNCTITINKNIPTEAGLGGGSSNAAAVLKGLNELFNNPLNEKDLILLSSELGSDVPFFIHGKTCLGKGRGEILEKLDNSLDLKIKIVKPENISISTKWAYEQIDSREFPTDHISEINCLKSALKSNDYDLLCKNLFNDFEMVVFSYYPELIKERRKLLDEGYESVHLCGSGSAIFGVKH